MQGQAKPPVVAPKIDTISNLTEPTMADPSQHFKNLGYQEKDFDPRTAVMPAGIPHTLSGAIRNPNVLLQAVIDDQASKGEKIVSTVALVVETGPKPDGTGVSNITFLQPESPNGAKNNAAVVQVTSTFWIETIRLPDGSTLLQLQYTQTVVLNFNGINCAFCGRVTDRSFGR